MDNYLAVVHHIGCDTCKLYGESIEIDRVIVGIGESAQEFTDVLADNEASTNRSFVFLQPQTGGKRICVVKFTLFQTLVFQVIPVRQHYSPVL